MKLCFLVRFVDFASGHEHTVHPPHSTGGGGGVLPLMGNLNATTCNDIYPPPWQQRFLFGPFQFQHDNALMHQTRSMYPESGVSSHLNCGRNLWEEVEQRL